MGRGEAEGPIPAVLDDSPSRESSRRSYRRAAAVAGGLALLAACGGAAVLSEDALDCLEWAGQRYCFPRRESLGIGSTAAQTTAALRVPLASPTLRRCNKAMSRLAEASFPYDNVDVVFKSVTALSSPASIYDQRLRLRLGDGRPDWRTAAGARCWPNQPAFREAGTTCLEREPADGGVHVTMCRPGGGAGLAFCEDESVSPLFQTKIDYHADCYPLRSEMRRNVRQYLAAHRSDRHG